VSRLGQRWNPLDVKPCGTTVAYRRHLRHGEPPCEACRQANNRASQDRYDPAKRQQRHQWREMSGWERIMVKRRTA
jgi:hypothetical protein